MKCKYTFLWLPFSLLLLTQNLFGQTRWDVGVSVNDREYVMPWNGGFNAPQFSNIDLNRDGITDLISFDRQGDKLRTYIHLPASGRWILSWDYANIFPPLVDWVLVADYNHDGVEDIFTSSSPTGVAGVSVYTGAYQNDQWSFTKVIDRDEEYLQIEVGNVTTNLYVSWVDIPSVNDIDGDGDLDILAFEPNGSYITYFANQSVENGWGTDSLRYIIQDLCWGKILENELSEQVYLSDTPDMCSDGHYQSEDVIKSRHSGSTILTFDRDLDLDMDALIGDISSKRLVYLLNGLNNQEAWITEQDFRWPSNDSSVYLPYYVAAYYVQLDDDPEKEILAAVNSNSLAEDSISLWRYDDDVADGPLTYHLTDKGFLQNEMIDLGSQSKPAIADVNADGLKDLLVGGFSFEEGSLTRLPSLWLYLNEGTLTQPYFRLANVDYLGLSQFADDPDFDFAPAFGDLDGNGSIDLIVGDQNGKLIFFRNQALSGEAMNFAPFIFPYMNINVGVSATPQIADINGDGLNDLIVGERTGNSDINGRCSNLNYFENIGFAGNEMFNPDPTVAPNTQCFGRLLFDIPFGLPQYSTPSIVQGKDGLLLVTGNDPGKLEIYTDLQNGKTGSLTLVDGGYGALDFGNRSAPALADLNDDGKFELIVGNQRGGLELFQTEIEVGTTATENLQEQDKKPYSIFRIDENSWQVAWLDGKVGDVFVYDVQGKMLQAISVQENSVQVNLDHYSAGMYFIQLKQDADVFIEKVMIP